MSALTFPAYLPGRPPANPGPLRRFLPPLEDGPAAAWLAGRVPAGAWLLDPFGSAPRLAVEAARAGYRVLVAANNPVARLLLELASDPPARADLNAALAELGAARLRDERLETAMQALYLTECQGCRRQVPAQVFLWKKGADAPYARIYACKACGDLGERPATEADAERARQAAARDGLARARVLERVASLDDPDREYARDALEYYPPRATHALATLINRLDGLPPNPARRRLLTALLLTAFDAANTLWPHPVERPRPKQLHVPPVYREHNVWMALEAGVDEWAADGPPVPLTAWPETPPESGGIALFDGRLRGLAGVSGVSFAAALGCLPRPNQAYWTLSALWAGWLWGADAVGPFKSVLRRRRYDWGWHTEALGAALHHLSELLPAGAPLFALLPEPETGFLNAALTAAAGAGFDLSALAARAGADPFQIVWERRAAPVRKGFDPTPGRIQSMVREHLAARGEPCTYLPLHALGLAALAAGQALAPPGQPLDDASAAAGRLVQEALLSDPGLRRFDGGASSPEIGLWGLREPDDEVEPLPDRVEMAVVRSLLKDPGAPLARLQAELHPQFPGLLTPPLALLAAVLDSYALQEAGWRLRAGESPAARRADLDEMAARLTELAARLDFDAHRLEAGPLLWERASQVRYAFYLGASAILARAARLNPYPPECSVAVLPGGRSGLLAYKLRRDPLLRARLDGWRFLKFRQVRAIHALPVLNETTFVEQLNADPIEPGQLMMF